MYLIDFFFYSILFLILGMASDLNKFFSPKIRLAIMFVFSIFVVINSQIIIDTIDIKIIDKIIKYNFLSIIFFSVCIVTLINGTNFIDGNNGNCTGYYILIYLYLFFSSTILELDITDLFFIQIFISALVVFFIFNLLNHNYLGDNGSYLIGFYSGLFGMLLYSKYSFSSLIIILIFIYPACEVTFSILRKLLEKKSPMSPDKLHLHQIIENSLPKSILGELARNNITTLIILCLNSLFFILLFHSDQSKIILIKFISGYILFYIIFYLVLRNLNLLRKK